jgi:hypothetical protein
MNILAATEYTEQISQDAPALDIKNFLLTIDSFPSQDHTAIDFSDEHIIRIRDEFIQLALQVCQKYNAQTGTYEHCVEHCVKLLEQTASEKQIQAIAQFFVLNNVTQNFSGTATLLLDIALELYKHDMGQYPKNLELLFPRYLHDRQHYIEPSGDLEASWMEVRYYPPKEDEELYTLVSDFLPGQGLPNIGRLRQIARRALPLIMALENYYRDKHTYPKRLSGLMPTYLEDLAPWHDWDYHVYNQHDQKYWLYQKLGWDISLNYTKDKEDAQWTYNISGNPPYSLDLNFDFSFIQSAPIDREE